MRVFLTGGTGLLGSHLARDLGSRGHEIVALYRSSSDTSVLSDAGCTLVEGDVRDAPDVLAGLMQGCTHVVHGAALVYASGGWPRIREANVEGTRNVLEAAHRAGVGQRRERDLLPERGQLPRVRLVRGRVGTRTSAPHAGTARDALQARCPESLAAD